MNVLPPLYKPTRTGATQVCAISYENENFTVKFGQLNGKMQTQTTECFTTNEGRANERNPEAQAEFEAKAKWDKKLKSGYSTEITSEASVNLPMKVQTFYDHKSKINYPAYESPKLNGVNSEYRIIDDELVHLSRGGERYPILEHQRHGIMDVMRQLNTTSLNGEQYIHGEHLQDIQSAVKKYKPLTEELVFYLFDLPTKGLKYAETYELMSSISAPFVIAVGANLVNSEEELEAKHTEYVAQGYEGLVVRNQDSVYQYNIRSYDVQKMKKALDAEYEIDSYSVDKNGHPVFLCHTEDGKPFKVKPKGTNEERLAIIENIDDYLDHWYKIEYETLSKDGIPQKPVGIGLRNCDAAGQPLE